jgi:hypothetical protein
MTMAEVESRLARLEAELERLKERLEESDADAAVEEGLSEIERGDGVPAVEAVRALGRQYGIDQP